MAANGAAGVARDADQRAGRGRTSGHRDLALVVRVALQGGRGYRDRGGERRTQGGPCHVHRRDVPQHVRAEPDVAPGGFGLAGGHTVAAALQEVATDGLGQQPQGFLPRASSIHRVMSVGHDSGGPTRTPARLRLPLRSSSQPPGSNVSGVRASVRVGDPLVVDVRTALPHRATGLALAADESGLGEQVDEQRQLAGVRDLDVRRLAERRGQRRGVERRRARRRRTVQRRRP